MCITCIATSVMTLLAPMSGPLQPISYTEPVDAVSIDLSDQKENAVSYFQDNQWSEWQNLAVENEQDPLLTESNVIMFPESVEAIRFQKEINPADIHPIRVSHEGARFTVAATTEVSRPKILSRSEWGADESFLYTSKPDTSVPVAPADNGDNGATSEVPQRVKDCEEAQLNYPEQFKVDRTEKTDDSGKKLRWANQYSKDIKMFVVHHTAMQVTGDERSGIERMRALYAYHANNRGWGDIGYHYLIDEDGHIYEGKAGGDFVVGGHAYCNNIGTIGIALLGNFEVEQPTQEQGKALQWLLADLSEKYSVSLSRSVRYHGKSMNAIVGHRDLLSTDCPGFSLYGGLNDIRRNVRTGDIEESISFPKPPTEPVIVKKPVKRTISKKAPRQSLAKTSQSRRVQRVTNSRASRLKLRQLRDVKSQNAASSVSRSTVIRSSASRKSSARSLDSLDSLESLESPTIRIHLSYTGETAVITRGSATWNLQKSGTSCIEQGSTSTTGMVRINPSSSGFIDVTSWEGDHRFRGVIECRVIDDQLVLINELPLEEYLKGLAEEPDTEPYEKQRAFAIAARTYAAHYLESTNRKFPGKPYDGDDSPARFQKYNGVSFEEAHPNWLKAVASTSNQVLKKDNKIIRAPYFSSDTGKTRTPAEAGWPNFPFAEIFTSKPDPWCEGMSLAGHGVGMSGCGAEGQANEGKTGEEILGYYYPGATIEAVR